MSEPGLTKAWRGHNGDRWFTFHEGSDRLFIFTIRLSYLFQPRSLYLAIRWRGDYKRFFWSKGHGKAKAGRPSSLRTGPAPSTSEPARQGERGDNRDSL